MTDKEKISGKRILDGLKDSDPEQWKEAWRKAQAEEDRRDARLRERINSGLKPSQ
ncbi:hypothetical protein [Roseovarius pacificus]|uniref:hypothetical protein n=1 Tax=Roseovarius pacificus TaxID=337701 RepID=UPI00403A6557